MIGSALSAFVPHVAGAGVFGSPVPGQSGPELVSQLPNGQIDLLGFNASGALIASDLIANTVGLPTLIGVAESFNFWPVLANNGAVGLDSVITQLPNDTLDVIGFSGSFNGGTVTFTNSLTLGALAPLGAVDQDNDFAHQRDANITSTVDGVTRETFDTVFDNVNNADQVVISSWVSGYGDLTHERFFLGNIGTNFNLSADWHIVDAGIVDHVSVLPLGLTGGRKHGIDRRPILARRTVIDARGGCRPACSLHHLGFHGEARQAAPRYGETMQLPFDYRKEDDDGRGL
jgi:hypothetical protein